jgi:hypothetical protein
MIYSIYVNGMTMFGYAYMMDAIRRAEDYKLQNPKAKVTLEWSSWYEGTKSKDTYHVVEIALPKGREFIKESDKTHKVYNHVEDEFIFNGTEEGFVKFMKMICKENEDTYSILNEVDALNYIEKYCGNLFLNP